MTPEQWQRVKALFGAALEQAPGERAAFLEQASGPEELAVRREVEALLAAHEESDSFLETPAAALVPGAGGEPSTLEQGQAIGRYRVLGLLGAGGMGQVYLAEDPRLRRRIALKLLPRSLSRDTDRLQRFEQEARAASALSHPNVCVIYEVGETREGEAERHYIAMEYVPGESLRQILERHRAAGTRMPIEEVLDVVQQAASGLAAAHEAGIVHRDVKPENVMVRPDGLVKVLDFGLAKLAEPDQRASAGGDARSGAYTEPGMVLGTVQYMSPEQARGLPVDHRTDIWSLGAVLYEMLAGRPAFEGPTTTDVMVAVLDREPAPLTRLSPSVPQQLQTVVTRALCKQCDGRYRTMQEMARELSELRRQLDRDGEALGAGGGPATAGGMRMPQRASAVVLRHALHWPVLVVLGLLLASGGVWVASREGAVADSAAERRDQPLDQKYVVAVLPFENLSADSAKAYFAAGMTEEITGQLSRLSALRVLNRSALRPYLDAPDRLSRMAEELGVGSVVGGSVRVEGDRARIGVQLIDARSAQAIWSHQFDRQLTDVLAVQSEIARHITQALQASLTPAEARRAGRPPTVNLAAYELYMQAQAPGSNSLSQIRARMEMLQQAIALDSTFAWAYVRLAHGYMFLGSFQGQALRDSGLVAVRKAIALDPDLAAAYFVLANLQGESGQLAPSRAFFHKALALDPNMWAAMNDLSITEEYLGRYDESLYWAMRAYPLNPNSPYSAYHVALPLLRLGDDAAAERFLTRAKRRFPDLVRLEILMSFLDQLRGRDAAAMERARRIVARAPDDPEAQSLLAELAVTTHAADAEEVLQPLARAGPDTRPQWFLPESFRALYAWTLAERGQRARADSLWDEALAQDRRDLANGHDAPNRPMEIAAINAIRGDTASALEWLERGYRAGFKDYRLLARDPFFDGLRAHPRYQQIVARMKEDVGAMRRRAVAAHDTLFAPRRAQ